MRKMFPEYTQYIAPDGEIFNFQTTDRFIESLEGFGLPPIEYITQQGPFQHGETVFDYRLQTRLIQVVLRQDGCSRQDYWDRRGELINVLRPNRHVLNQFGPGILRKKLADGTVRDLRVLIAKGAKFSASRGRMWDEHGFAESLQFIAHDPVFFNPEPKIVTWTLTTVDELVFPFTFRLGADGTGLLFASSVINESENIAYVGTWFSFPTIQITGPMNGPRITNVVLGEKIELDYAIPIGEVVTISLEYGNKTVENDSDVNLIGKVSTDSDLATFRLESHPTAPGGINEINVFGGNTSPATEVKLSYYENDIGF